MKKEKTKFKILGMGRKKDKAHVKLAKQNKIELSLKEFFDKLGFDTENLWDGCECCCVSSEKQIDYIRNVKNKDAEIDIFFGTSCIILNIRSKNKDKILEEIRKVSIWQPLKKVASKNKGL